ncbi:MAG TPA: c-type cytochrome [Vicinamibacteria bacterium]|nr:c-type cytochrome [Vicinamibacteria bacterium]
MTMRVVLVAVSSSAVLFGATFSANAQEAGKEAFLSNGCNRCHAVESQGIEATAQSKRVRGPDLSKIGESRDAEWLAKYIEKEVQANDKDHPVAWKGDNEALEAMATWLASLKTGT